MNIEMIKSIFEKNQNKMKNASDAFPWGKKECYVSWLAQTLDYASGTSRILALTGAHFEPKKAKLTYRFFQHAMEEKGHDNLLRLDAKGLGFDLNEVPLLPIAEAFHKSLYYWIYQNRTPVIMGWILLLEGFAVNCGPSAHLKTAEIYGAKATSFLRVHTEEDPDHVEKAFEALALFTPAELHDVAYGLNFYCALYCEIMNTITKAETSSLLQKAA